LVKTVGLSVLGIKAKGSFYAFFKCRSDFMIVEYCTSYTLSIFEK